MVTLVGTLLLIILFRIGVWPIIDGFIDGYMDATNGRPYDDKTENEE